MVRVFEGETAMYIQVLLILTDCSTTHYSNHNYISSPTTNNQQGNRKIALCTVVGLLEDGETYSTELKQRQKPAQGKMGQWEHELVVHR